MTKIPDPKSVVSAVIEGGRSALSAATSGVVGGAKFAAGAMVVGGSILLNFGLHAARRRLSPHRQPLYERGEDDAAPAPAADAIAAPAASPVSQPENGSAVPPPAADATTAVPSPGRPAPMGESAAMRGEPDLYAGASLADLLARVTVPLHVCKSSLRPIARYGGRRIDSDNGNGTGQGPLPEDLFDLVDRAAFVPSIDPSCLGDAGFRARHGLRYAYVAGEMANGIASEDLVEAMGRAGMLGFFGAAGLAPERVERAIDRIQSSLGERPWGFNLIHSPGEPLLEEAIVDLYLRRGVRLVSASAFLDLTPQVVRYRVTGIHRDPRGRIVCPHRVIAKVSRAEVARKFFAPPAADILAALVEAGHITADQARLAARVPVAEDLTAEADSGGHTDNRPAITLLPAMIALRDEMQTLHRYETPLRVGAAGGIATPASVAAAFAMGAAYVMTGSINQSCVEAGTSEAVREMLAQAGPADVMMAPAADMFEMGVKVQVLKWGTMFPIRARKLYDLYREFGSLDALPPAQRALLERDYFRCTLDEAWAATRAFWASRDPRQVDRAGADPRHKMALVFRSYLGRSSDWANSGDASRKADYQVWCGPAMGAFNEWTRGTFLAEPANRRVVTVALNLLYGAAVLTRVHILRAQGVPVPGEAGHVGPRTDEEIGALLEEGGAAMCSTESASRVL